MPSEIRCIEMIRAVLRVAGAFHTGFGEFCRRSLQPTRHRDSSCSGTELWPCPPPRWHWTACQKLSPKRRRRKRLLETRAHCLQYVVVSLNWLNLGCPISPPPSACVGSHLSDGQHDMLERLEDLIHHFLKAPDISFDELGRAAEKLANLCKASFDLSAVSELDHQDLQNFLDVVSTKVDPYGPKYGKCVSGSCDISCSSEHKGDTVPSPDVEPWQPETLPARVPLARPTQSPKKFLLIVLNGSWDPYLTPYPFCLTLLFTVLFREQMCCGLLKVAGHGWQGLRCIASDQSFCNWRRNGMI